MEMVHVPACMSCGGSQVVHVHAGQEGEFEVLASSSPAERGELPGGLSVCLCVCFGPGRIHHCYCNEVGYDCEALEVLSGV